MSVTTTDNPITTAINRDFLQDYDIHLTGDDNNETAAPPNTDSRPPAAVSNPPGWPADYRGVPPYRPINMNLDRSQRPWGGNPVGDLFVFTMLHGVWLNAQMAWIWRITGGRISNRIFRYKVGGEF